MQNAQLANRQIEFSGDDIASFLERLEKNRISRNQALEFLYAMQDRALDCDTMLPFVRHIRKHYPCRQTSRSAVVVNIVGTGGGRSTFNISTTAAFVAAASGAVVIKSGSSSYTSRCGALDLLEAMGINLNISFEQFEHMIAEIGLGFVNPAWYAPILRRLAVAILPETFKTVGGFVNVAGPLLSPVDVGGRLIGVKSSELIDSMAECIHRLGMCNAIVCWSDQGMDEFCSVGNNYFRRVTEDGVGPLETDFAGPANDRHLVELEGGTPMQNAAITQSILEGAIQGVKLETVLRNAAYILVLANQAQTIDQGMAMAAEAIRSGRARKILEQARRFSSGERGSSCRCA